MNASTTTPLTPIQSAVPQIGIAINDAAIAREMLKTAMWTDAEMWLCNAISQLQAARAKVAAHIAAKSEPNALLPRVHALREAIDQNGGCARPAELAKATGASIEGVRFVLSSNPQHFRRDGRRGWWTSIVRSIERG